MPNDRNKVAATTIPSDSAVARLYARPNLADAFAIDLPTGSETHPEVLARFIFANQPEWLGRLMQVRDAVVVRFGLKTANQLMAANTSHAAARVAIFKIYSSNSREAILGEDDRHLDFRLAVHVSNSQQAGEHRLTLATTVNCHNAFGRAYIFIIAPFHRQIVKACLRRAARLGWPAASLSA